MHRKFILLILSAAIAIAGLSAPARADGNDAAKLFVGIAALALIGKALKDDDDDRLTVSRNTYRPRSYYTPHSNTVRPNVVRPNIVRPNIVHPKIVHPKPVPPRVSRYDLPRQCLRNYRVNHDNVRLLGAACLRKNYRQVNALPYACQLQISGRSGSQTGYEPVCLREHGYRIARW